MTPAALLDTAVPAYVYGKDHPLKQPCVEVIAAATAGRFQAQASVEMVQELLFHRLRMSDRTRALAQTRDVAEACILHPFDQDVMERMFTLVASHPRIGGRDAVHAATALRHGIPAIISPDTAYDGIPGLRRVDPRDIEDYLARQD
jgi:predicted nucleic acid-binding protein